MTYRLLRVLLDGLPGESAYKTAVRDAMSDAELAREAKAPQRGHGRWSHTDLRLAAIDDRLGWVIYAIYHAQGGKPQKPEPTPRPGVTSRRQPKALTPEGHAHLRALREEHAALHGYDPDTGEPLNPGPASAETG